MRGICRTLLLVACAALLAGADVPELRLTDSDDVVRDGLAYRCRVIMPDGPGDGRTPLSLDVTLSQDGVTLAAMTLPGVTLAQLRLGIPLTLFPDMAAVTHPLAEVRLGISLTGGTGPASVTSGALTTPRQLQARLEALATRLTDRPTAEDALPALWLEEAGERMLGVPSLAICHELAGLQVAVARWLDGTRPTVAAPGDVEGALRDPVDGSVQPWRLHLPAAPAGGALPVALVLRASAPGPKHIWPELPAAWLVASRVAGIAVVEVYPAGDRAWTGIAVQRAWPTLAEAKRAWPGLEVEQVALVGIGSGAAGALRLAEDQPERVRLLAILDGQLPAPPPSGASGSATRWDALALPGARPAHLAGIGILVSAGGDAALRDWQVRAAHAGARLGGEAGDPGQDAWWRQLAAPTSAGQPARIERIVLAPGPIPGGEVEELTTWGVAGAVEITPGDPRRYTASGIAALRSAVPRAVITGLSGTSAGPVMPRKRLGQATGPIPAYATGPFVIVVGTGENLAARTDNRALALALRQAWGRHAQGLARMVDDVAFRARDYPREHLVLIGNPLSNQVLAQLQIAPALPVLWDARTVAYGAQRWPRAEHRGVALCWPHPAGDGRLLVILDGLPPLGDGLPLAGLPDLVIGGADLQADPAVWKLFGNDWK